MPRNHRSVSDEKHVDFVHENSEERRATRRLDKRHGFLAQIQNIQHSRDDYEQECQQKRKERAAQEKEEKERKSREIIMAREKEEKERKVKESEEKERRLKEREDVEQRKMQGSKKDQLTRADLVSYWGHEGFAEQQKQEKLRPRRSSNSARSSDSPRLSRDSGDSSWDTRSDQTSSSLDDEFVVRKPSKQLEMYVPPRRAVVTMESSPITKPVKYPVEKPMKGRGENKYGKGTVSRDSQLVKHIPLINDAKQNDCFQTSTHTIVFPPSGGRQSSIKESRRGESDKNPPKPDKLSSAVLRDPKTHSAKTVQQPVEIPKVINLNRSHSRKESSDESGRESWSADNFERDCTEGEGSPSIRHASSKDRERMHNHPPNCDECVPCSLCCSAYDKNNHNHCIEKSRESQFLEHCHRCKCSRATLQRCCRAEVKGCNLHPQNVRDTQCDFSRTARCDSLYHERCRSDRHYDIPMESPCLCHRCGSLASGNKGSLSPVRSVDNQEEMQAKTKGKKKELKKKKKKTEEVALIMSIELGGEIKKLRYYESETVLDSALAFCKKYNFGGENQEAFAGALAEHMRRYLNDSPEV